MSLPKSAITVGLIAGFVGLTPQVRAVDPVPLSGNILGQVKNTGGVAQMGAKVVLLNRFDQVVREVLSDPTGKFLFDRLTPGAYAVRVSLASFMPVRRPILVLAGSENLLEVSLATLFSSVELVPAAEARGTLMSDEWKWVLRSSRATRPVLRLTGGVKVPQSHAVSSMFSDTSGVVRLSAGDSNPFNGTMQQAMGTGFAVETSVYGESKVRLAGNFGYSAVSGLPSAGIRSTYMRERDGRPGPEMALTVRQIYFPASVGTSAGNGPVLRTVSLSTIDELDVLDILHIEYGFSADSITLFGRMNYFSPFGRATYDLGDRGQLKLAFSAGAQPTELLVRGQQNGDGLNEDLTALGQLPRLSRRSNRAAVERTNSYEIGYTLVNGSRTVTATMYRDVVSNGAFLASGAIDLIGNSNLLPDLNSRGYVVNMGDYQRNGYSASITQKAGDRVEFTIAVGRGGALVAEHGTIVADDGDSLRAQIRQAPRTWVTLKAGSSIPLTGTHLAVSYGWTDFRALTPVHVSLTNQTNQQMGWNIYGRQPLPTMGGLHMELTAELRNLLAQGYLPVTSSQGRRAVVTNSPRAVRGGLSFIF